MTPIPYGRQWIDDADVAAVASALRSDFLTTGPQVAAFEEALCAATGARHAVAVNSGTAALHCMYAALGMGPGDEVVTSPLTFAATANAALYLGATVRFADVCPKTGNLDPARIAAALTPKTRLVVAIDFAGHPADYKALREAVPAHIELVADAAHSLGAAAHGVPVGRLARASTLSFHPVKPITTAEGGAVVTDDPELARRAARFRSHGIERDAAHFEAAEGPWWYEQQELGFNYRLTDLQCALGLAQMRRLAPFIARRRAIAARYTAELASLDALELPHAERWAEPGWHLYPLRVRDAVHRRPLFDALRARGIGVQVHYIPVYWHPYYRRLGFARGLCPVAESFYARELSLPMFPRMTDDEVTQVLAAVRACVGGLGRTGSAA